MGYVVTCVSVGAESRPQLSSVCAVHQQQSENVLSLGFMSGFSLNHICQQEYFDEKKDIVLPPKT